MHQFWPVVETILYYRAGGSSYSAGGLTFTVRLKDHIRLDTDLPEQGHTLWCLQIDGHRLFPPRLCVQRHGNLGPVHTDHLGSKVCQDHATERGRSQARQLNDSHSSQCHDDDDDDDERTKKKNIRNTYQYNLIQYNNIIITIIIWVWNKTFEDITLGSVKHFWTFHRQINQ